MSSIIPPPVYTEASAEDLAIQLEQMKAMMEQMRLDKTSMMEKMRTEREQQEAKHKAECEAVASRLHAEAEEARELSEIQKKLYTAAIPQHLMDQWLQAVPSGGDASDKLIKHLTATGDILLWTVFQQSVKVTSTAGGKLDVHRVVKLIITKRHVYSIRVHSNAIGTSTQQCAFLHSGLHYMPVYTFDKPLTLTHIKMLSIITQQTQYCQMEFNETHKSIMGAAFCDSQSNSASSAAYLLAQNKFESVIRLIPGSYKNGDWHQMDGFFGLYFNQTTMEVNEFPGRAF
jgi:hypothetical protein